MIHDIKENGTCQEKLKKNNGSKYGIDVKNKYTNNLIDSKIMLDPFYVFRFCPTVQSFIVQNP